MNLGCSYMFSLLFVPIYNFFVVLQCPERESLSKNRLQYFSMPVLLDYKFAILGRGSNDPMKQYPSEYLLILWTYIPDPLWVIDTFKKFFSLSPPVLSINIMSNSPRLPLTFQITYVKIQNSFHFLENALGALDKTHIKSWTSAANWHASRDRKGGITQNCLAVCSFHFRFLYIITGF